MNRGCVGNSVPGNSFQNTAGEFFTQTNHLNWPFVLDLNHPRPRSIRKLRGNPMAPLLKMKRHVELITLMQEVHYPIRMHWSRRPAAFAAGNDPINGIKPIAIKPLA